MFGLFNKKFSELFPGYTDHHSHLLPGVDDGIKTMEDTLSILSRYESLGVKTVWLTPHIMEDVPNTTVHLRERFEDVKAAYHGPITLHLAAENMIDNLFIERLHINDLLPLDQNRLLVETSYFNPPMDFHETLKEIRSRGYYPVLAHPERYVYMDEKDYKELQAIGIIFQLNLPSLNGFYGKTAQRKAHYLLDKGYYKLTGMDLHSVRSLEMNLQERLPGSIINKVNQLPNI